MLSVNDETPVVISNVEITGLFTVFIVIFLLLYPENTIEKQVLKESSNYDLTAAYLENMLRHDPSNETLMIALARAAQKSGKSELALHVLDVLTHTKDLTLKRETQGLKYVLLKEKYENANEEERPKIRESLKSMFVSIVHNAEDDRGDIQYWYDEAVWLGDKHAALRLASKEVTLYLKDTVWLERVYYLAGELNKPLLKQSALDRLLKYDVKQKKKWLKVAFYQAIESKDYSKAEILLKELDSLSDKGKDMHISLALQKGEYSLASQLYMELREKSHDTSERRVLLIKALEALEGGNMVREAAKLAQQYEDEYFHDRIMIERFLKLYLAAENLDAGTSLSKKLLGEEREQ